MNALIIKMNFLYLFLLVNIGFSQHEHNTNMKDSKYMLFAYQNSEFTAKILSNSESFVVNKKVDIYLRLSAALLIDSPSLSLTIKSIDGKIQKKDNQMEYSSGLYNSNVLFQESGLNQFIFSFNLKDSAGNLKKTVFSFTGNVEKASEMHTNEHGFMGMSNFMMIIMGAGMLVMMALAITTGTGHK